MYIALLADGRPRITGLKNYLTNMKSIVMTNCIHGNRGRYIRKRRSHLCSHMWRELSNSSGYFLTECACKTVVKK